MANSYKEIIITPNKSHTSENPKIEFRGGNTTVNTAITIQAYHTSNGTLSFEGTAGQLFSVTNDLTGSIFSVNDVSGIPSIEVFASGQINLAQYSGNVSIGTNFSLGKLTIFAAEGSIGQFIRVNATSGTAVQFKNSQDLGGSITIASGGGTSYNTGSDARLKHDIVDAPEASNLVDAIKIRSFKWNVDNSEQRYGMIAQELATVAPEAVHQPANPDEMMGLDYSKLVPMLIKEVQSLRARVAQLEGN
jgi:hypothetical protein